MNSFQDFKKKVETKRFMFQEYMKSNFLEKRNQNKENQFSSKLYGMALYSTGNQGKCFRPLLALFTGEVLGCVNQYLFPYALALECSHISSLIEDDLPSMDNSDYRRGQPSCHKKFGEAMSILASNSLLIESYQLISENYKDRAPQALEAISVLSQSGSFTGMMSGQAMDLCYRDEKLPSLESLQSLHYLKTGKFISASIEGAGVLCQASPHQRSVLRKFGDLLGFAFQIKDDLLDKDEDSFNSVVSFLGEKEAEKKLESLHEECFQTLKELPEAELLGFFVTWNSKRGS